MVNPASVFLEWFSLLRDPLRREIAFNVLSMSPDVAYDPDLDDPTLVDAFTTWLNAGKTYGKIVLVREAVDCLELDKFRDSYLAVRTGHLTTDALNRWRGVLAEKTRLEIQARYGITNN